VTTTRRPLPRPRAVLTAIARTAARLCEANDASIFQVDGDGLCFVAKHGRLPSPNRLGEILPLSRSFVVGRTVLDRRTIHVRDLLGAAQHEFKSSAALHRGNVRTILVAPLLRGRTAIGAIVIRRTKVRPFTAKQIALLRTFADQAAMALENTGLLTELQEKNRALVEAHAQTTEALEQQTATSEVLRVISSSPTDLQPVFDTIAEHAMRLCHALHGVVLRFDGELIHLVALANASPEGEDALRRLFPTPPGRHTAASRAILTGATIDIPDVQNDPDYAVAGTARTAGYRSIVAVPMLRDGQAIGTLNVHGVEVGQFTEHQVRLLETFADQAVIAIENVRLFTELEEKNRALTQAHAQVSEALEQQTTTSGILRVISSSPTDAQPVFDTIAESAVRLCDGLLSGVYRFDGDLVHFVAHYNWTAEGLETAHHVYPRAPSRETQVATAIWWSPCFAKATPSGRSPSLAPSRGRSPSSRSSC
jgi:two-component system NtrC family sensor kinase